MAYGATRFTQGRHRDSLRWSELAIDEARKCNLRPVLARAFFIADMARSALGLPPGDAAEQALAIYRDLQKGHIDRSLLAPNLNDYFAAQTVVDFRDSLGSLGEPLTFRQTFEHPRGGMMFRVFQIQYPARRLELSTYTYPDGKLEQFLVEPAN